MKKEALVKQIESLIGFEKRAIPLLSRHISSSLLFSELKMEERTMMLDNFQKMAVTKAKHLEILNQIKDEVTSEEKDVF